jgi:alkylated DNA repair dioxygenase AlkB
LSTERRSGEKRNSFTVERLPKGAGGKEKPNSDAGSQVPKRVRCTDEQADLFPPTAALPSGFSYQADFITSDSEGALLEQLTALPFKEFEFHGFQGKRRVVWFGWRYDFNGGGLRKTEVALPPFLAPIRDLVAAFAQIHPADLQQVLVTEYRPGAAIGWHKDRSIFGIVIGLSLLAPCRFRLRRKSGARWERAQLSVEPRSIYLLRGPARTEWEHSIPAVSALRYSITFRTVLRAADR